MNALSPVVFLSLPGLVLVFGDGFMYKDTKVNPRSPFPSAWCVTCQGRSELKVGTKENNLSIKSLISLKFMEEIIAW